MPLLPRLRPPPPASASLLLALSTHVPDVARALFRAFPLPSHSPYHRIYARQADVDPDPDHTQVITGGVLIPILVLLSGIFAGLTLGYMSLDETQLHVLRISGSPKQREYAAQIEPIRKNGHLLLVTLLLANMITNETLPIIADPVLGGGPQSVVVSTILIVIFAEIIPQSICTRHGLYIGAKMAPFMRLLLCTLGIVAWPVARLLEAVLGPHHGIIYRRAELKELIALHASVGDLRADTVTIIGATLDVQEKTAAEAMTPVARVFMLDVDARLDYATLRRICLTGHSRIPVYEEIDVPAAPPTSATGIPGTPGTPAPAPAGTRKAKRILGILLVKQCVLLDPSDAVPLRRIPLNRPAVVAHDAPLLGILDRFQQGRSHIAVVSRLPGATLGVGVGGGGGGVADVVRRGVTKHMRTAVQGEGVRGAGEVEEVEEEEAHGKHHGRFRAAFRRSSSSSTSTGTGDDEHEYGGVKSIFSRGGTRRRRNRVDAAKAAAMTAATAATTTTATTTAMTTTATKNEQAMPADAVLDDAAADEFLAGFDATVAPLGIITLEDVLEELIGEEIYDEFDAEGAGHGEPSGYVPPGSPDSPVDRRRAAAGLRARRSAPDLKDSTRDGAAAATPTTKSGLAMDAATSSTKDVPAPAPIALTASRLALTKGLSFLTRSRSAPPGPRDGPSQPPPLPRAQSRPRPPVLQLSLSPRSTAVKAGHDEKRVSLDDEDDDKTALSDDYDEKEENKGRTDEATAPAPSTLPAPPPPALLRIAAPGPRSASPAPLEAILLERSRSRRASANPNNLSTNPNGPGSTTPRATTPVRGTRFKSSPAGVVVAEHVGTRVGGMPSLAVAPITPITPGALITPIASAPVAPVAPAVPGVGPAEERIPQPMDRVGPDIA